MEYQLFLKVKKRVKSGSNEWCFGCKVQKKSPTITREGKKKNYLWKCAKVLGESCQVCVCLGGEMFNKNMALGLFAGMARAWNVFMLMSTGDKKTKKRRRSGRRWRKRRRGTVEIKLACLI